MVSKRTFQHILLLFIFLPACAFAAVGEAKKNLCTVTINSNDEAQLFKSNLSPANWNFIELAPAQPDKASVNWFNEACKQNIRCDILLISGHFAGSFFGSTKLRLSMEDLERNSCDQKCDGILKQPREVFLFGCNTLASKEKDSRSPEEYMRVLLADGFSTVQASQIVSFRYSGFGDSYKHRMTQVFATTPRIYGFSSIGPSGLNVAPKLQNYFDLAVKNYVNYDTYVSKSGIQTNKKLFSALSHTSLSQATGAIPKMQSVDEKPYCYIRSEQKSSAEKLRFIQKLFHTSGAIKILPHIEDFLHRLKSDSKKLSSEDKEILDELATDEKLKHDLLSLLQLNGDIYLPLKTHVLNTLKNLDLVSNRFIADAYNELVDLNTPFTEVRRNALCSLLGQVNIPAAVIPKERWLESEFINSVVCLKPNDKGIQDQIAKVIQIASDSNLKATAIWFFYSLPSDDPAIQAVLATALRDDTQILIRQSAVMVLRHLKPTNLGVINLISEAFMLEKDSAIKLQIQNLLTSIQWKND